MTCTLCKGRGALPEIPGCDPCPDCDGSGQVPDRLQVLLRRPRDRKHSHYFVAGSSVSLCRRWSLEDDLVDPRRAGEKTILWCRTCWRRFCRGLELRAAEREEPS